MPPPPSHFTDGKTQIWCVQVIWSGSLCISRWGHNWNFHALHPGPLALLWITGLDLKWRTGALHRRCHLPALCWFILAAVTHLPFIDPFAGLCFLAPFNLKQACHLSPAESISPASASALSLACPTFPVLLGRHFLPQDAECTAVEHRTLHIQTLTY